MIEKLDKHLAGDINSFNMSQNIAVALKAINKINELVDAVNKLQTTNTHIQNDLYEMCHSNTKTQNVQDKFAEQRKWIGKLCKFWDDDPNDYYFDKLNRITLDGCYVKENGYIYENCEPVKPDDDIIYQGGNNE